MDSWSELKLAPLEMSVERRGAEVVGSVSVLSSVSVVDVVDVDVVVVNFQFCKFCFVILFFRGSLTSSWAEKKEREEESISIGEARAQKNGREEVWEDEHMT